MLNKSQNLSSKIFKKDIEKVSTREGFGQGLVKAGEKDERVIVLTADLGNSTRSNYFKEKFPNRFFDVGVAEQALATVASGMAAYGKIPFINSYAVFSPGRNWEQIRTTIAINDVPVKIASSHVGISVGPDGVTHQALEDIALMRSLPNIIVITPADFEDAKKAVLAAAKNKKPTYIRTARAATPVFTTKESPFEIGRANILWETKDPKVALIACGSLVYQALKAAKALSKSRIGSIVINCHTIKPLDEQTIIRAVKTSGCIVTIEEHQIIGGMGSAVAELLAKNFPAPVEMIGIQDKFGESGQPQELLRKFKLTAPNIVTAAKRAIKRKTS